jgi:threonine dehydratase
MTYFSLDEFTQAAAVVGRHVTPTPQYAWPLLCAELGTEVWLKHENCTPTGAFKVRGGLVYVDRLVRERPEVRGSSARPVATTGRAWRSQVGRQACR